MRCEVLTAVNIKIMVFLGVTGTNVSKKHVTSTFCPEDGGRKIV
jgi:hypothetical protein